MFTCPEGVDAEDSDREIRVPFGLFIRYMQLVCRALNIRLVLPDVCELILSRTHHGRLDTALVSTLSFQVHCRMYILGRRGIGVWTKSLVSLCWFKGLAQL